MKTINRLLGVILVLTLTGFFTMAQNGNVKWNINASLIEACSCPLFCQCFFTTQPASHHGDDGEEQHFCKFNIAFKINKGNYGGVKLDGVGYWLAGDLGSDLSTGKLDWAELTFDPLVSQEQREAVMVILTKLYPVEWGSFTLGEDARMVWYADNNKAIANLNAGKTAEIILTPAPSMGDDPVVIKNLKYWAAPKNDGFELWPNEVQAYRVGDKQFEYKGTNGFLITLDMTSKDVR